ncbi:MAG: hypothetical protein ACTIDY_05170 [Halomonadaceae bacterium]|uniref:Uncharacterized protein n=1 Tax=Halomonas colorata TaxID=2742615 RepID=A0ABR9FV35_9GAMM|nr:hypothetical protein [Halomonas colorata]MBE0462515.1 hypothetical protein [Halomonas colorata]
MDSPVKVKMKRPHIMTLCMAATAASVLLLAGCGDNEEEMPPAQQPESMEQGALAPEQDAAVTQEPTESSPIEQSSDEASSDSAMSGTATSGSAMDEEPVVPQESMQPEDEARTQDMQEDPGFGEGTDPMPGANEENDDELTNSQ